MIAYKFLGAGAVAPFTGFRWPVGGEWVSAPADRAHVWIHACRARDLSYWLDDELWRVELDGPVREARYQIASPRGRLAGRVASWNPSLARAYAEACAWRARDVALPYLPPALRQAVAGATDLGAIAKVASAPGTGIGAYLVDAASYAQRALPAVTSYVAAVLASSTSGELAAFEDERAWQSRWLAERLGLELAPATA